MTDFIAGKLKTEHAPENVLFDDKAETVLQDNTPKVFSAEAQAAFDTGRELWKYYHAKENINVNASLYDIREHFQGRNEKGRMNSKSQDRKYMQLIGELRRSLDVLADKVQPKVYEYGFLIE